MFNVKVCIVCPNSKSLCNDVVYLSSKFHAVASWIDPVWDVRSGTGAAAAGMFCPEPEMLGYFTGSQSRPKFPRLCILDTRLVC